MENRTYVWGFRNVQHRDGNPDDEAQPVYTRAVRSRILSAATNNQQNSYKFRWLWRKCGERAIGKIIA